MVHLRLTGVSQDGRKLLLVSDAGVEFTVDVDDRLRAALDQSPGGDQARLAQLEMQMDSTLRPRDIQARIRAGETPESVAQVAGTSVEKVMPYAAPVLAERAHVAQRAQRASLRRRPAEGGGASARTLGDAVGSHLRGRNVDPDTVAWDAWRREDGRWTLTGAYTTGDRVGAAHFSFDAPGQLRRGRRRRRPLAARRGARRPPGRRPSRRGRGDARATTCRPPAGAGCPPYLPRSCRSARTPSSWSTRPRPRPRRGRRRWIDEPTTEHRSTSAASATAPTRPRRRSTARVRRARPTAESDDAEDEHPDEPPVAQAGEEDPRPGLRAELGRDHVRRRGQD